MGNRSMILTCHHLARQSDYRSIGLHGKNQRNRIGPFGKNFGANTATGFWNYQYYWEIGFPQAIGSGRGSMTPNGTFCIVKTPQN
jgi:hypothetical protein